MTPAIERAALVRYEHAIPVVVADATERVLLELCEMRGWSLGVVLQLAVATGARALQQQGGSLETGTGDTSTNQPVPAVDDIIARLCAENVRLCAENARLRDWIAQCRSGRAPGIPTVDAPSPAWLWRYRPFR